MRRVARRVAVPGALTRTSSVRTAPRARDTAARALRAMRAVKVVTAPAAALARPLPIATLRPPVRMPRRRAALALTISRASMVQAAEQAPASLRPRLDIRAGRSEGRSATERVSRTEPASAWSVAVAPRESRSAPRAARVRRTLTPPVPALVDPPPSLTGRRPRPRAVHLEAHRPAEAGVAGGVGLAGAHRVGAAADLAEARAERAGGLALRHHALRGRAARHPAREQVHRHGAVVTGARAGAAVHDGSRARHRRDARNGRGDVDGPRVDGWAAVDVALRVERPHLERVASLGQIAERVGRRARVEVAAVEPALELRAGPWRAELETRVPRPGESRRSSLDLRVRRVRVRVALRGPDREAPAEQRAGVVLVAVAHA